jgi:hypothetical protein
MTKWTVNRFWKKNTMKQRVSHKFWRLSRNELSSEI